MLQKHDPVRVSVASGPPTCEFALCFGRVIILSPLLIPGPLPATAQNADGKAGTVGVTEAVTVNSLPGPPSRHNDGAANAPAGTPQLPNLLSDYALRPPWKVAGVDYAVGVPRGTALKDPTTISMPGVSIDTTRHIIFVTGSNVTLDGYDFSLHGGWSVYIERGRSDTVIENSKFLVGANNLVPIAAESGAGKLTVEYCTIDGGGFGVAGNPGAIYTLISYNGSGGLTVEYDWLKNAPQHIIEFRNGTLIDQYNLIQNAGYFVGAHVNDRKQYDRRHRTVSNRLLSDRHSPGRGSQYDRRHRRSRQLPRYHGGLWSLLSADRQQRDLHGQLEHGDRLAIPELATRV